MPGTTGLCDVAIVGIGATAYYKRGQSLPKTTLELACEAILAACEDAGCRSPTSTALLTIPAPPPVTPRRWIPPILSKRSAFPRSGSPRR
ncbi:thiolase domain protein [Mycobacterium xenopi 3993]|nr:thiolase domain protein [Mycobacterium xenopi 3993]